MDITLQWSLEEVTPSNLANKKEVEHMHHSWLLLPVVENLETMDEDDYVKVSYMANHSMQKYCFWLCWQIATGL